jgi:hypothetical protein
MVTLPIGVLPLVSVLFGSLLTAWIGYLIRRARPVVIIDEITLSASPTPSSTVAVPNLGLAARCKDSEFVTVDLGPRVAIGETEYIDRLRKALAEVKTASADLPALHKVADELNDCLQRNDYGEYAEVFSRESPRIWPSLISARARGEFAYRGEGPPPLNWETVKSRATANPDKTIDPYDLTENSMVAVEKTPCEDRVLRHAGWANDILIDKEGEFIMPIDGPRDLGLPWTKVQSSQRAKAYVFALRTAVAVAAKCKNDLQQVTTFLLKVDREHSSKLKDLRTRLERELDRYDRLVVKGIIANMGGSPVSAANRAKLFINLSGQAFAKKVEDDKSKSREHRKNEAVKMCLGSESPGRKYDFESSLTVEGKAVSRFIASSTEPVTQLSYAPALLGAMTGGDRKCYLGAMVVAPRGVLSKLLRGDTNFTPCYSAHIDFRNSESDLRVPDRESRQLRNRARVFFNRSGRSKRRRKR